MARKSIGFKIGIVTFCIHLCLAVFAFVVYMKSNSSTAGLIFIYFLLLDAPIDLLITLLPFSVFDFNVVMPLIIYGVLGSAFWFLFINNKEAIVGDLFGGGKLLGLIQPERPRYHHFRFQFCKNEYFPGIETFPYSAFRRSWRTFGW
jgi:hypothetical protein